MFHLRTSPDPGLSLNTSTSRSTRSYSDNPVSPLGSDFDISDATRDRPSGPDRSVSAIKRKDIPMMNVRSVSNDTITEQLVANKPGAGIEMESLMNSSENFPRSMESEKLVKWGVQWYKEPTYMIIFAAIGLGLAVGHHGYYSSLHGTLAGSNNKQQWAHNFGNVFAIAVVAVLHAANGLAYSQYFWLVVRRKPFTVNALDSLFSLTSDPFGFFNWEVWRSAPMAGLLALTCWIMALAGILPPGTLTVVPGTVDAQAVVSMDRLNFNQTGWVPDNGTDHSHYDLWTTPTPLVLGMASQAAQSMDILPFAAPAPNSSYSLEVRGPYLQCDAPNSTQQPVVDYYQKALSTRDILTASTMPTTKNSAGYEYMADFSAFVPWLGENGWTSMAKKVDINVKTTGPDVYNNWDVDIPSDYSIGYTLNFTQVSARQESNKTESATKTTAQPTTISNKSPPAVTQTLSFQIIPQQMFVQTVDNSLVCTLVNGTRDVHFNFTNGVQNIWYGELKNFEPLYVPQGGYIPPGWDFEAYTYMAVFVSLTNMLSGNVTTTLETVGPPTISMAESSSRILLTGLSACEEFTNNSFTDHPPYMNLTAGLRAPIASYQEPFTNNLFTKPEWMCRNRTLARAIEDLATNITISMLSQSQLTTPNQTSTTVSLYPSRNVYKYNPLYLLLSYGIALLFTLLGTSLGVFAFRSNGVIHSTSFSSIIATTRSHALDNLSRGHSLGTFPMSEKMRSTRLRFGGLQDGQEGYVGGGAGEKDVRAGFGIAEGVVKLRKGGRYV